MAYDNIFCANGLEHGSRDFACISAVCEFVAVLSAEVSPSMVVAEHAAYGMLVDEGGRYNYVSVFELVVEASQYVVGKSECFEEGGIHFPVGGDDSISAHGRSFVV